MDESKLTPAQKVRLQLARSQAQAAQKKSDDAHAFEKAIKPTWYEGENKVKQLGQNAIANGEVLTNRQYEKGTAMAPRPTEGRLRVDNKAVVGKNLPVLSFEILRKYALVGLIQTTNARVKIKSSPVSVGLIVKIKVSGNASPDEFSIENSSYTLDSKGEAVIEITALKTPWQLNQTKQIKIAASSSEDYQSATIATVEMPFIVFWGYGEGRRADKGSDPTTSFTMSDLSATLVNPDKNSFSSSNTFVQPQRSTYSLTGSYSDSYILPKPDYSDAPVGDIIYPLTNPANEPASPSLPFHWFDGTNMIDGTMDEWNNPLNPPAPVWYDTDSDGIEDTPYQWWDTYTINSSVTCEVSPDNLQVRFIYDNHYTPWSYGDDFLWSAYSDRQFKILSNTFGTQELQQSGSWFKHDFEPLVYIYGELRQYNLSWKRSSLDLQIIFFLTGFDY